MNEKSTLELEAAKLSIGQLWPEILPRIAIQSLEAGMDSPSLRILAGLSHSYECDDIFFLFRETLKELEIVVPTPQNAIIILAKDIAMQILSGEISPYLGAKSISQFAHRVDDYPQQVHPFIYAASEWEDRPGDRKIFEKGIIETAKDIISKS